MHKSPYTISAVRFKTDRNTQITDKIQEILCYLQSEVNGTICFITWQCITPTYIYCFKLCPYL